MIPANELVQMNTVGLGPSLFLAISSYTFYAFKAASRMFIYLPTPFLKRDNFFPNFHISCCGSNMDCKAYSWPINV